MGVLEVLQVGSLVGAKVVDDLAVSKKAKDLLGVLLELGALGQSLIALLVVLGGPLGEVVDGGVKVADEVTHVGLLEEGIFGLGDVVDALVLGGLLLKEVEQRKDEVAVQVGDELGQQRVLLRDVGLVVCHGCECVYGDRCRRRRWHPAVCMYELTFSRESARPNFAKELKAEMLQAGEAEAEAGRRQNNVDQASGQRRERNFGDHQLDPFTSPYNNISRVAYPTWPP